MPSDVRLTDLEFIRRYSLAVRQEHAPAAEVATALRKTLAQVEAAATATSAKKATPVKAKKATPVKKTAPAKKKKAAARKK